MTVAYEKIIAHLRERLMQELGDGIESIILFGSVARKEAHEDSDIDILIVTRDDDRRLQDRISKIRTRIDLDNNTLTALVQMSRNELERYVKLGSPFIETIAEEGVILHDRGFFEEIRGSIAHKG
jgi:predicted nucleotidyltransferase